MWFLKIDVCLSSEHGAIALRSFAALLHGFKLITNINLNARPAEVGPGVISRVPAPARACGAACKLTGARRATASGGQEEHSRMRLCAHGGSPDVRKTKNRQAFNVR